MTRIEFALKIAEFKSGLIGASEMSEAVDAYTSALLKQCNVSGSLPLNLMIYRNARSMDYSEFCRWFNERLGGNDH